jgi:hypothetical protein
MDNTQWLSLMTTAIENFGVAGYSRSRAKVNGQ